MSPGNTESNRSLNSARQPRRVAGLRFETKPRRREHRDSHGRPGQAGRDLTLITPILAPYRIPVFNALADALGDGFHVIFLFEKEPRRRWRVPYEDVRFSYEILGGLIGLTGGREQRPLYLSRPSIGTLLRRRPNHVLVGGWDHPEFIWALLGARVLDARLSLWCESFESATRSGPLDHIKRALVRSYGSYLVPGIAAARYLRGLGAAPELIFEAPNSVDVDFYAAAPAREREHLLVVSRLAKPKGVDVVLRALAAEGRRMPPLIIAGHGPEETALKSLAQELDLNATFAGHVDAERLRELYAGARALLFPTLFDPWGLVVNEALAAGTPVIVSDAAGCAESIVEPGKNGEIVPAGDVEALRAAVRAVLDPAREADLRAGARQTGTRYTPEHCAAGFLSLIGER